jgi:phenylacetate-CoA ligase
MILQNAYGYGLFTGGLGLHYGAEKLGMTVVPVSGGMTDRQILLMQDFKPEAICCTPSYALALAEEIKKRGIGRERLNLQLAILGAEPWTETVRQDVEAGLGVSATNIYGLSEIIGPGVSQEDFEEKGSGSYIWEDHFFPEVVDQETGLPVPEGKNGVLVFTSLTRKAMPLLRYRTNDIASIYYEKGSKRTLVKMSQILGRSDDMLIIRGVNLFHTQVEAVLKDFGDLSTNYQLIVKRERAMDDVVLKVEVAAGFYGKAPPENTGPAPAAGSEKLNELYSSLQRKIKNNIGLTMQIDIAEPGSIPRSEGGKLNRIVDLRKK